jgi:hypothetical protein
VDWAEQQREKGRRATAKTKALADKAVKAASKAMKTPYKAKTGDSVRVTEFDRATEAKRKANKPY